MRMRNHLVYILKPSVTQAIPRKAAANPSPGVGSTDGMSMLAFEGEGRKVPEMSQGTAPMIEAHET